MKLKSWRLKIDDRHRPMKTVIKVSCRNLENVEEAVLNKDLQFATTILCIQYLDMSPIKVIVIKISKSEGDELR